MTPVLSKSATTSGPIGLGDLLDGRMLTGSRRKYDVSHPKKEGKVVNFHIFLTFSHRHAVNQTYPVHPLC